MHKKKKIKKNKNKKKIYKQDLQTNIHYNYLVLEPLNKQTNKQQQQQQHPQMTFTPPSLTSCNTTRSPHCNIKEEEEEEEGGGGGGGGGGGKTDKKKKECIITLLTVMQEGHLT